MKSLAHFAHDRTDSQSTLLDALGEAVIVTASDGTVVYWNAAAERLYGWSSAEAVGTSIMSLTVPEERAVPAEEIMGALRQGRSWHGEFAVRRRDGTSFPVRVTNAPVMDEAGQVVGMIGVSADLSEQHAAEAALRESEERFRGLFDTMGQGVVYVDRDGRFVDANSAALQILGMEMAALGECFVTDDAWGLLLDDGSPCPPAERWSTAALETGRPTDELVCGLRNRLDGGRRWVLLSSRPRFREGDDQPWQAYTTITDITPLREAKLALEASEARLRRSEERLRRVIETMNDGIVIFDVAGRLSFANRAAEAMLGLSRSELGERSHDDPVWRITHPGGTPVPDAELPFTRVLSEGVPLSGAEYEIERADGGRAVLSLNAAPLRGDAGEVDGVVAAFRDVTTSHAAAARLRLQATLLNAVGESVVATDLEGRITYWNRGAELQSGWEAGEVIGRLLDTITATPGFAERMAALVASGESWTGELVLVRRDGSEFPGFVSAAPVRDASGEVIGLVGTTADLTQMKLLESQLHQAQRMEAIGRLAGGVAHDFNNILTGIQGYAELAISGLEESDPLREDIGEILTGARRAADLTRQLLALSRKQVLESRVLDLGAVVGGMQSMLGRLIGEDVELEFACPSTLGSVRADPGQIHQVVLNLAVNARDAMPGGGRLSIGLHDDPERNEVVLRIGDTGTGIPADVRPHIFEPFFTTKGVGLGTGLGLSTVYGIVAQSGGRISVLDASGGGTVFEIALPRVDGAPDADAPAPGIPGPARGETILYVEDDEAVRILGSRVLRRLGYQVLAAAGGGEALLACERHPGTIDLLLTDVVMPQMSGRELAERLLALRPGLRVLYVSGYTDDIVGRHGVLEPGVTLVDKPFSPATLGARVREALDAPAPLTG